MSRTTIILLVALAALCTCACIEPPSPSAFYRPPDPLPAGPPGTILRQDALSHVPNGARGWRILYLSSDPSGRPIAVSGVIFAPLGDPPPGGRPVVAWAHPTTGVASRCAPSLRPRSLLRTIAGLKPLLAQGYVVVATDYPGLGTPGPHPYLIGQSEARSVLDSVRAARLLPEAGAGDRFALWGHSQGGHASLWSGQIAAAYVPDLRLVGVAAAAPATQFTESFGLDLGTLKGKVFASMAFTAWSKLFAGASLDRIATRSAVPVMEALGRGCIETTGEALLEAAGGVLPARRAAR